MRSWQGFVVNYDVDGRRAARGGTSSREGMETEKR
jgi:hypothetical protein